MLREEILLLVVNSVKDLVDTFPDSDRFEVSEETTLLGQNADIDSLSLVSVIVDLESLFYENYRIEISLTDDRAMMRPISPFGSISALTDYIAELVAEK